MNLFKWSKDLETGVPHIDSAHKQVFKIADTVYAQIKSQKKKIEVKRILNFFQDYTVHHFADEERLMEKCGYLKFAEHKALHKACIKDLKSLKKKHEAGSLQPIHILSFLTTWVVKHICIEDQKFKHFIK